MFRLVNKCKLLKAKTKIWNLTQFGNTFRQLRNLDRKLSDIQTELILDQLNLALLNKQDLLLQKRSKLIYFNHEYWKQKSKTNYLKQGDASTSYFHAHASIWRNKNQITEFTLHNNNIISSLTEIAIAIMFEFCQRFLSNHRCSFNSNVDFELISPLISLEDNAFLIEPVMGEEIKSAIFDLPDKSRGPDGFPPFFFQKYWTMIGNSVIRMVQAFFHYGKLIILF